MFMHITLHSYLLGPRSAERSKKPGRASIWREIGGHLGWPCGQLQVRQLCPGALLSEWAPHYQRPGKESQQKAVCRGHALCFRLLQRLRERERESQPGPGSHQDSPRQFPSPGKKPGFLAWHISDFLFVTKKDFPSCVATAR